MRRAESVSRPPPRALLLHAAHARGRSRNREVVAQRAGIRKHLMCTGNEATAVGATSPPERVPRGLNLPVPPDDYVVPIGVARVVREGRDLSLISYGSQAMRAVAAADQVSQEDGASIEVIDLHTLIPYD